MNSSTNRQRAGAVALARPNSTRLERQINRFDGRLQTALGRLIASQPYLADLAFSFPGLLATIARCGETDSMKAALIAVTCGAPLKKAAALAGMAWWLRPLPPEAFTNDVRGLPDTPTLRLNLANHRPKARRSAVWLQAVATALRWGDEDFAVWIAREIPTTKRRLPEEAIEGLCLFAWSSRQDSPVWNTLLRKPWTTEMSLASAQLAARALADGVHMYVKAEDVLAAPWLPAGKSGGLRFIPLTTTDRVLEEANTMRNCLRSYGYRIARGHTQIVSVQSEGQRLATMSIGFGHKPYLDIIELTGPENAKVERSVWLAARTWLDGNEPLSIEVPSRNRGHENARHRWHNLWRPYWLEKRRIPDWLPLRPCRSALLRV